jgi:hypothetical protein
MNDSLGHVCEGRNRVERTVTEQASPFDKMCARSLFGFSLAISVVSLLIGVSIIQATGEPIVEDVVLPPW